MSKNKLLNYQALVDLKYKVYSALFTTLPFDEMKDVNAEVLSFQDYCKREILLGQSPTNIVNKFFNDVLHHQDFEYRTKMLFLIMQFLERQVVLLDALEDAAFPETHQLDGSGSLTDYLKNISTPKRSEAVYTLLKNYHTRIVLTAHPTQFYPFQVLEIIEDLAKATKNDQLTKISRLLLQLGKTSFKNPSRPSPVDEADVHIYYLERIFYPAIKDIQGRLSAAFIHHATKDGYMPIVLELGFWPGGDRDGNPNVTPEITLNVARRLKFSILNKYIADVENLKRRLTFPGMWPTLDKINARLFKTREIDDAHNRSDILPYESAEEFIDDLTYLKDTLLRDHNGLFSEKIDAVLIAARTFKFYFASIDIRQDSSIHTKVIDAIFINYADLDPSEKMKYLQNLMVSGEVTLPDNVLRESPMIYDVIGSLRAIPVIQKANGVKGCHRYIISNTHAACHVMEVLFFAKLAGLSIPDLKLDIVPLFETINDLENAEAIMQDLYHDPLYRAHLNNRDNLQFVMLGFSDGTKDGGYLMANWSILQCKKRLYELSKNNNINIQFFDGRGGAPARGGGNVYQYYRAMDQVIDQEQIQITVQGQTISSDFGTLDAARYHIEQLLTAGMQRPLSTKREPHPPFTTEEILLLDKLSQTSHAAYQSLKNHPLFVSYMQKFSPINFYGELNNASRPPRRKSEGELSIKDLRAIPFVGAWSQLKQNVPVYYGIGTAIKQLIDEGEEGALKHLYHHSLYFRTLLQSSMQSVLKTNFSITHYLMDDKEYGEFWKKLYDEAQLCEAMLKIICQQQHLLESDPVMQASIALRESIVIPLSIIQQYALIEMQKIDKEAEPRRYEIFKKIVLKSLAASTNASRNST
jgi:phosphoenolpyruvate carboxylase